MLRSGLVKQNLISLLIPFAAYLAAEHLHCSGILAAVSAGITMSYAEISGQALAVTRVRRSAVWETVEQKLFACRATASKIPPRYDNCA
jgi:NhaP-type Na+/H+ or K+/H+ antiporter